MFYVDLLATVNVSAFCEHSLVTVSYCRVKGNYGVKLRKPPMVPKLPVAPDPNAPPALALEV